MINNKAVFPAKKRDKSLLLQLFENVINILFVESLYKTKTMKNSESKEVHQEMLSWLKKKKVFLIFILKSSVTS